MTSSSNLQNQDNSFLKRLAHFLDEQIASGDISVDFVCREMNTSRSTLYRKIKKATGCSPTEYIKKIQLKKAAELLKSNYGNVSEVAYETGFNNLSYFAKCFRERFGVTPTKYIQSGRLHKNIPLRLTSFVGRERETEEITQLINTHRLVSLTGPAGSGKTRMAVEIVNELKSSFRNGITVVFLASISDPGLVPSAILQQLNAVENPGNSKIDNLTDHLRNKEMLLLLDNFEHLIPAAPRIKKILQVCAGIKILTTTREILHLSGEYEYPVLPLAIPEDVNTIDKDTLSHLSEYPSVKLFTERARNVKSNFELSEKNAADIIQICNLLDGLPLALELAASQIKLFTPGQLSEKLEKDMELLRSGNVDRPERHITLHSAITWSYNLLSDTEKQLFRRLSLFPGSFDLDAAEALWDESVNDISLMDGMRSLLDKNFLQSYEQEEEIRFILLETLKNYGQKILKDRTKHELIKKMTAHYLELARKADSHLKGPDQKYWVDRINIELDNYRGILSYLELYREVEAGLRLTTALCRYWNMQNLMKEGREWLRKMIDLANSLKYNEESESISFLKGKALSAMGVLMGQLSVNFQNTADIFRQCITVFRRVDDREKLAENLNHYGWIKAHIGDYEESIKISNEAKNLNKKLDKKRGISVSYNNLGWVANARGNLEKANEFYKESLSWREKISDLRGIAYVSTNLALAEIGMTEYGKALARLDKSEDILVELNDIQLVSWVHTIKSILYFNKGQFSKAIQMLETTNEGWKKVGNHFGMALSYGYSGLSSLESKKPQVAEEAFKEAGNRWNRMNSKWGNSFSTYCLAEYEAYNGRIDMSLSLHKDALELRVKQKEQLVICESLEAIAKLLIEKKEFHTAVLFMSAASELRKKINAPCPPRFEETREYIISTCKEKFDKEVFTETWSKGKDLTFNNLISDLASSLL